MVHMFRCTVGTGAGEVINVSIAGLTTDIGTTTTPAVTDLASTDVYCCRCRRCYCLCR